MTPRIHRFLTLHARLLFAWTPTQRKHVRRSVGAKFRVRKPKPAGDLIDTVLLHEYPGSITGPVVVGTALKEREERPGVSPGHTSTGE